MSRTKNDVESRRRSRRRRRARRRRYNKNFPVLIICILIVIVAAIGIVSYLLNRITPTREKADLSIYGAVEGYAPLLLNHQWSEDRALWENDHPYLNLTVLQREANVRFYWDMEEHKLLYTMPTEVMASTADTEFDGAPVFLERDGEIYVSLQYAAQFADSMVVEVYSDPSRVVLQTQWDEITVSEVTKKTCLRMKGGIKSPVITELDKDSRVIVLEGMDNWSQVQTEDGWLGYVENKYLGENETIMEEAPDRSGLPEYTNISLDHEVCMVWQQSINSDCIQLLNTLLSSEAMRSVNTVGPTWFSITGADGSISSRCSASYVRKAHENGLDVWAVLENVNNKDVDMKALLDSTTARTALVSRVMAEMESCGADGLNLDLESISEEMADGYIQLVREFSVECRKRGIVLSVDNYVPTGWNSYYNLKEQGTVVDYVVIMAYDEHYGGSDMGSTASLDYVQKAMTNTYESVSAGKVICGVPFYSRLWKEELTSVTSEAIGMDGMQSFISTHGATPQWDDVLGQNVVRVESGDTIYHLWVEDARSIEAKLKTISGFHPAGIACWKQGMQSRDIWGVLASYYGK